MEQFRKFIPLSKIEEQTDGSLFVYGKVTAQKPDHDKEVCDYAGSKPYFQAQAAQMLKLTSIEGMTPSLMPHREMHQLKAIGAGRAMDFFDEDEIIRMGFHVVDPDAVKKYRAGVFVGFSQGGEYVKKWPDPDFKGCTRYIANPMEVSAVDSPCLPEAVIESMKNRTFEMQKSNGSVSVEKFDIPNDTEVRIERLTRMVETLAKRDFDAAERRSAAASGAALPDGSFPIHNDSDLRNAIHDVGRAKDPAEAKRHIESRAKTLGLTNLLPDDWKSEKAATGGTENAMKITDVAGYKKAAKTLHDHLEGLKDKHEALCDHVEKVHKAIEDKHDAFGEHIEKCMKACKAAMEENEPEEHEKASVADFKKSLDTPVVATPAAPAGDIQKKLDDLTAKFAELMTKLAATPATPAAASGIDVTDLLGKGNQFGITETISEFATFMPPGMEGGDFAKALKEADIVAV
jgi:hypothetical protein